MNKVIRVLSFALAIIGSALLSASAWAEDTCKVIAVNFNSIAYKNTDKPGSDSNKIGLTEDSGIIGLPAGTYVNGAGVNQTDGKSGTASNLTVCEANAEGGTTSSSSASVTWSAGGDRWVWMDSETKMLKGYLDDKAGTGKDPGGDGNLKLGSTTTIKFTNIPFARYNVYVYMQCDTAAIVNKKSSAANNKYVDYETKFGCVSINDFSQCKYTDDGSISSGQKYSVGWGVPQATKSELGKNVIWFKDQTGSALNLSARRSEKDTSQTHYYRRVGIAAVVIVDTTPKEATWTGAGDGSTWADGANWNNGAPGKDYAVTFDGTGAETTYNLENLTFASLDVQSGNWKTTLDDTCFTSTPITIASGASFTLAWNGEPTENPFSTEGGEVVIAGTLDLGGAKQSVNTANGSDFFKNGGALKNGNLNATFTDTWCPFADTTFTIGEGATLTMLPDGATDAKGEFNLKNGAHLIIDGGTLVNTNKRTDYGQYLGCDGETTATMDIMNGGTFYSKYKFLLLGRGRKATGVLNIDNGTLNLADGAEELRIAGSETESSKNTTSTAIVNINQGEVTAKAIKFNHNTGTGADGSLAKVTIKDSVLNIERIFKGKKLSSESYLILDNVTINTTAGDGVNVLDDIGIDYTLQGKGVTVNTVNNNVMVSGLFAGEAPVFTKTGAKSLKFGGLFRNPVDFRIEEGEVSFENATIPAGSTLAAKGGTTIDVTFGKNGFSTKDYNFESIAGGEGAVTIDIALKDGITPAKVKGKLFADLKDVSLIQLADSENYELTTDEDGNVIVKSTISIFEWEGAGEDANWSTGANWNIGEAPTENAEFDFKGAGAETIYDLGALTFGKMSVKSGTWKVALDGDDLFTGAPLDLVAGATFALANAKGVENPFATTGNDIRGTLDLGGAKQAVSSTLSGGETDVFKTGSAIVNGEVTVTPSGWWRFQNTTFTVAKDATFTVKETDSSAGQLGFLGNACLVIDGGTVNALNKRGSAYGGYLGCDNPLTNTIRIVNGGTFNEPNQFLRVGYNKGATGILSVDNGTVNLGDNELRIACTEGATGVFAMTNGTLTAKSVKFSESESCLSTFILKDSVATIGQINKSKTPADGSSVVFDNATIVDDHGATALLQVLDFPYTIAEGGLTIKVADSTGADDYVSFPGTFEGEGDFIIEAAGSKPREAKFTGEEKEKGFTGKLIVSDGITVGASGKIFAGGLDAAAGSTLKFSDSTFAGDVTIADGVKVQMPTATGGVLFALGDDATATVGEVTVLDNDGNETTDFVLVYDEAKRTYSFFNKPQPVKDSDVVIYTNDQGELILGGEGDTGDNVAPFTEAQKGAITSVFVGPGVTRIGERFFKDFMRLKTVEVGKDVANFGEKAFWGCLSLQKIVITNPKVNLEEVEKAVVYQMAIDPDGKFYQIPAIEIAGHEVHVEGKVELTDDKEWNDLGPVDWNKAMTEYDGECKFFRFAIKSVTPEIAD